MKMNQCKKLAAIKGLKLVRIKLEKYVSLGKC